MRTTIIFIALTILFSHASLVKAQTTNIKFGVGLLVGGSKLFGDIENTNTNFTGGIILRYSPFPFLAISASSTYGTMISGVDDIKTKVLNTGLSGTLFLFPLSKYRPFLTLGLSNFHYSTKDVNNQQFYYKDGSAVSGWERALQVGIGFEFFTGKKWAINTFGNYMITGIDDLDAINQGRNDGFFSGMIGLIHYFHKDKKTIDDNNFNKRWKYEKESIEVDEIKSDKSTLEKNKETAAKTKENLFSYGIYFEPGSAIIQNRSKPQLVNIFKYLSANPEEEIELLASNDINTSNKFENNIIYERAKAIKTYLVNLGINPGRIIIDSNPGK